MWQARQHRPHAASQHLESDRILVPHVDDRLEVRTDIVLADQPVELDHGQGPLVGVLGLRGAIGNALIMAARDGNADMVQVLVEAGAKIDKGVRGDGNPFGGRRMETSIPSMLGVHSNDQPYSSMGIATRMWT